MDTGTLLTIILFVLSFPVGVAGNLLAPKIGNWWASRSKESLIRRIAKLETRLRWVSREVAMEDFFDVFRDLAKALILFFYSMAIGTATLLIFLFFENSKPVVIFNSITIYIFSVIAMVLSGSAYAKAKRRANPEYKEKLENSIASLKTKLEEKSNPISTQPVDKSTLQ